MTITIADETRYRFCLTQAERAIQAGDLDSARDAMRSLKCLAHAADRDDSMASPDSMSVDASLPTIDIGCGISLTRREYAVLMLLPDGALSRKDIGRQLGVSLNTVKSHLKSLFLKLDITSRAEAVEFARSLGSASGHTLAE